MSRADAQALLEAYAFSIVGGTLGAALAKPDTMARAAALAERRLNRAARRALGARGNGRARTRPAC